MPDGNEYSDEYREYCNLVLEVGDLAPGETAVVTFTREIDLTFDVDNFAGWATLDVIFYDDTGDLYEAQLDWVYIDHEVDTMPPTGLIDARPPLLGPDENTISGWVFDASPVPWITLEIEDWDEITTTVACDDPLLDDTEWRCTFDLSGAEEGDQYFLVRLYDTAPIANTDDEEDHDPAAPYYDNARRPDDVLATFTGENTQGTWQLVICDYFPEEDDGAYHRSQLILTSEYLPENTRAAWSYALPDVAGLDTVERTLDVYGVDSVGNRTAALTLDFAVDTIAPALTVTSALARVQQAVTMTVAQGQITDGGDVAAVYVVGFAPSGAGFHEPVTANGRRARGAIICNSTRRACTLTGCRRRT